MFRNSIIKGVSCASFALSSLLLIGGQTAFSQDVSNAPKFVAPRFEEPELPGSETDPPSTGDEEISGDASLIEDATENASSSDDDLALPDTNVEEGSSQGETSLILSDETEADESLAPEEDAQTAKPKSSNGEVQREPYDVYKENGHYFVDWEKPDVAIVFTGMTNGYIEPCGCAGMDRMKGGLSRRNTFLSDLRKTRGWDTITIDSGQITVGFGVQEELKFDMAMNAFQLMEYDAVGIGKGELKFPAYFLLTYTAPTSATSKSLYTSANIGVYGFHPTYTLPYKIIERGGKKIGVVSVVCRDETIDRRDENLLFETPEKKLKELAPKLEKEGCDANVLIVHGTEQETLKLAQAFPMFKYILTADTPSEPPAELKKIGQNQYLIEVGEKGKFAVVLGMYGDGTTKYQRVALDSRYESSPEITLLMKDYQTILKNLISTKGFRAGLGVNPARSPQAELLGKYVGAQKCRSCHEEEFRTWAKSKHATAWKSLKETANPPRDFDPECIGCHVVGWDGLQRFPYADGYSSEKKTSHLTNVGCESCHGPGERHMTVELGDDENLQEKIRSSMRLGSNVKKVCYSCHDGDNSPEFDFDVYYPLVEHSSEDNEEE